MARIRIRPEQVGRFSIEDSDNSLYWNDQLIHTESSVLQLTKRQGRIASAIGIATVITAVTGSVSVALTIWPTFWKSPDLKQEEMLRNAASIQQSLKNINITLAELPGKLAAAKASDLTSQPPDPGVTVALNQITKALQDINATLPQGDHRKPKFNH